MAIEDKVLRQSWKNGQNQSLLLFPPLPFYCLPHGTPHPHPGPPCLSDPKPCLLSACTLFSRVTYCSLLSLGYYSQSRLGSAAMTSSPTVLMAYDSTGLFLVYIINYVVFSAWLELCSTSVCSSKPG